jgi:hypothetical protein
MKAPARCTATPAAPAAATRTAVAVLLPAVLLVAVLATACASPTEPPTEGMPTVLAFSIGGYGVGSTTLELHGDSVLTYHVPWDFQPGVSLDSLWVTPSADAWRAFWAAARSAGVQHWRSRYDAPHIADGVGWSIRMESGAFRVRSEGSNAYPDSRGRRHEAESTPAFRQFIDALRELSGRAFL